jgi:hypothetical protein
MMNRIKQLSWLLIGMGLGLIALAIVGWLIWATRTPEAREASKEQIELVEPTATSYVITAVVIGSATPTPTPHPVPTNTRGSDSAWITATPTPIVTPTQAVAVLQPKPELPTVTPPTLGTEPGQGLGGLIYGVWSGVIERLSSNAK